MLPFLLVLFIVVPLVEIYVIIQVGQAIGPWWTIGLLIADSIPGAVTFTFGDPGAGVYGLARAGLAAGGASGLAVLFRDGETVAVRAEGGAAADGSWESISAAGVTTRVVAPLETWEVAFDGGEE